MLLPAGAVVDTADESGWTALMIAPVVVFLGGEWAQEDKQISRKYDCTKPLGRAFSEAYDSVRSRWTQ